MAIANPVVKESVTVAKDLYGMYKTVADRGVASITEFTKDTNIIMRLYIEQKLTDEEILVPLINMLNQITSCYVMSALNLTELVQNGKTVRHLLREVSTESFVQIIDVVESELGATNQELVAVESLALINAMDKNAKPTETKPHQKYDTMSAKPFDMVKDASAFYNGRVLEVTIGTANGATVKVYLYVQLLPYIVASEVVEGLLKLNFTADIIRRYMQLKSGQIRFWKDFVFARDEVNARSKILKADKDGILREIENHKMQQKSKSTSGALGFNDPRHNVANAITIADYNTFMTAAKERGVDINSYQQRQSFFHESLTTMLVLVDPYHNQVELFMSGIRTKGEYTFAMIKSAGKSGDGISIKDVVTLLAHGSVPKF